jgi:hypothetical protein
MESEVAARVIGPAATGTTASIPGLEGVAVGGPTEGIEVAVARGADVGTVVSGGATTGVATASAPHPETSREQITRIVNT